MAKTKTDEQVARNIRHKIAELTTLLNDAASEYDIRCTFSLNLDPSSGRLVDTCRIEKVKTL